jgi:riboflavin kinase/FMN adenylyltransferase
MQIFHSLDEARAAHNGRPIAATVGNFDGVHRGHQLMFAELTRRARERNIPAVAVTFQPHSLRVLRPHTGFRLLTPLPQKLELLAATGLDAAIVLPFTPEFAAISARSFAADILRDALRVSTMVEGASFRFGHHAELGAEDLAVLGLEMGFDVAILPPLTVRGDVISSSRIRHLISHGLVHHARALLGRLFSISGRPAPGRGYGSRFTVPTINLGPYDELLPAHGVYVTRITVGAGPAAPTLDAVTNIGNRPTFGADSFSVETHILDFQPVTLDESTPIKIDFLFRLRGEVRWPNAEALKAQIALDVKRARRSLQLLHHLHPQA